MPRNNGKSKRAARKASALLRQAEYNALSAQEKAERQAAYEASHAD